MTTPLWIAFGLLLLLVIFLIISFFLTPKLTADQRGTLKFLSALCAGFSGGFFTGDALFRLQKTAGNTTFALSGTAGCALFLAVLFFYPKVFKLDDSLNFSILPTWTFRSTVDAMVQIEGGAGEFRGFTAQELDAPMQGRTISSKSLSQAISQLRLLTVAADVVRPYDVTKQDSVYRLTVRQGGAHE
jgi:hypothetical protein